MSSIGVVNLIRCRLPRPGFCRELFVTRAAVRLMIVVAAINSSERGASASPMNGDDVAFPQATPEELGLVLPQATPKPGDGRRVVVQQEDSISDAPTVARVYLEVGDVFVVLLPDGSLTTVPQSEAVLTDRPFEPLDKKQLAQQFTKGRFAGFRTRTTRRYLYVYNSSEAFAQATSVILETMYPALCNYCRRQKLDVSQPEFPLVVIMFRNQEEFEKYRNMPEGLVAYYNTLSNHIVMFEQSKLMELAPELAFKQSVSTIAHEGVHQILHNIGVQKRLSRWPVWFSEGLAEYFAPTDLHRRARWKGVGFVNDLRLHELSEFYRVRQGAPTDGELIRRVVETQRLDSLGYATAWAIIHRAERTDRDRFGACLSEVSQLAPLQSVPPGSLFEKHFGQNYAACEQELTEYLTTLPYVNPVLNQTYFVLVISDDQREAFITSSPAELHKQLKERASDKQYQIRSFPNRDAANAFARAWLGHR